MYQSYYPPVEPIPQKKENVVLGTLGAFLFSLGGAVVYFLLEQLGYLAGLSGLAGMLLADLGYGLFSGNKRSKKGAWIALVCTVITLVLAGFSCVVYGLYDAVSDMVFIHKLTLGEAINGAFKMLQGRELIDAEVDGFHLILIWGEAGTNYSVLSAYLLEVGLSLLLCSFSVIGILRKKLQDAKGQASNNPNAYNYMNDPNAQNYQNYQNYQNSQYYQNGQTYQNGYGYPNNPNYQNAPGYPNGQSYPNNQSYPDNPDYQNRPNDPNDPQNPAEF